jgi:hypothetical protein
MSDDTAKVERLRSLVGKVLPPDLRDSFVQYSKLDAFVGEDGEVDETRVMGHLTAIYAATQPTQPQQPPRNWGQGSGYETGQQPGANAHQALARRHGVKNDAPQNSPGIRQGATARAALAKRHGVGKK